MPNRLPVLAAVIAVGLALGLATAPRTAAQSVPTLATLKLPLPGGTVWKVLQGYNGGTHVPGPEQYALDLVRDGGPTGGTEVIAPASGSIWFAHQPGAGNGCASIKVDGSDGLIVQMCHIVLHRSMRADERVSAGAPLGAIGADGRVGNNGTAHLHLSLHRTPNYGVTRVPAPFAPGSGVSLEGMSLPPDGSRNQYACPGAGCVGRLVSTNGAAGVVGVTGPASTPSASPSPAPGSTPAPAASPAAAPTPSAPPVLPAAPLLPAPGPLRPGIRALVAGAGAGDCVNIREGPSMSGSVRQCLPDGARLRLAEGPVAADGHQWWRLEGLGWAVSTYLSPLAPSLEAGGRARVNAGRGECLNVRMAPAIASAKIGCLADGSPVRLAVGPFEADGMTWWQVEGAGWVAGEYLAAEE